LTVKRSVSLAGHRTSVALEPEFWAAVDRLAAGRGLSLAAFVTAVDRGRGERNLASALRVAVLKALEEEAAVPSDAVETAERPAATG
jgi:predicted DNA-binding ribbon-helix-helix protein